MTTTERPQVDREQRPVLPKAALSAAAIYVVSAVLWVWGVSSIPDAPVSNYGLLFSASPAFVASLLLLVVGFAVAIRISQWWAAAAGVLLLVIGQRSVGLLTTEVPIYTWTYKHLGVVDYIQTEHGLAREIDLYHRWPGLFAATAWFSDLTGVAPITVAHGFTLGLHLLLVVVVYAVGRSWGLAPLTALTATFITESINWVGQDYYSPQGTAMLLVGGVLILVGLSRDKPVALPLTLVIFGALVVTHQLTPYWLVLPILLLAVTRQLKPWWLPLVMGVELLLYLVYNFDAVKSYGILQLDVVSNVKPTIRVQASEGQRLTSIVVRAFSALVWLATFMCVVWAWRKKAPIWRYAILALTPLLILAGQGYGGEAIYRVFLFSSIGCGIVLAGPATRLLQGRVPGAAAVTVGLVVMLACSAQGFFGNWFPSKVYRDQVEVASTLLDEIPAPAFIMGMGPGWPERVNGRYAELLDTKLGPWDFDLPLIREPNLLNLAYESDEDYDKFQNQIARRTKFGPVYLVLSDQMQLYSEYFGVLPVNSLPRLRERLQNSPDWSVYGRGDGYIVFRHAGDEE